MATELRKARLRKHVTQEYLAEVTGLSQSTINRLELRGLSKNFIKVLRLCQELEVDPSSCAPIATNSPALSR